MLKAEMAERIDELEPMVEDLEEQIESLIATNTEMAAAIEALTDERDELQTALETAQATLSGVQAPPDPEDQAAVRDWLLQLLIDLRRTSEVHEAARRATRPAIDSLAQALRGRWPDEPDPDPTRLAKVRRALENGR